MSRVLIVDDILENRYMLETLLKGSGYDVFAAVNGAEALDLARKSPPDLVITDILMPVMDGFTLCRQWKADSRLRHIPFVFYTATYTEPKDEALALSLGAERFIIKPKKPEEMIALLREVLGDADAGRLVPCDSPLKGEKEFLQDHDAAVSRKLDRKMAQLEQTNAALQEEIAERKRIESELLYRNTILATQQETSLDAILVVDDRGKMISFNRRFVDLWGIPAAVIDKKSDKKALQAVLDKVMDPKGFLEKVNELYEHKDRTSRDLVTLRDGRILDRYSSPVIEKNGQYRGRVWYFRDITEQRKLEQQLLQAQKMEAIGLLAGGIAHDFNNILTAIIGFGSVLEKEIPPDDPMQDRVKHILEAGARAAQLTRSLLAFSRKQVLYMRPTTLNSIIVGEEKFLRRIIGEDIDMKTILHRDPVILADSGQIEQILLNLATNARDAMPRGGSLTVETDVVTMTEAFVNAHGFGAPGAYATISVTDTGVGMDEITRQRMFDPFFTTKEVGYGTGLGMAIIYGIVKQHKGYINVYSQIGMGTTVRIYIPVHQEQAEPQKSVQSAPPVLTGTETVLLAEDDATLRSFFRDILTKYGYTVIAAENGTDAISRFTEQKDSIQLVIVDMVMPKKNGREVYEEVRRLKPGVKVIFSSGYAADRVLQEGFPAGSEFIAKPASPHDYLRKIRDVLDGPRAA
ncbi:MAG TPA: response regulator [Nitrospirota bacterium]|nr:response regulator [Nitrospirota bacterium]